MAGRKPVDPVYEESVVGEIETLFAQRSVRVTLRRHAPLWCPPTDVMETEAVVMVVVEVAGMHGGDFNVSLHNRQLTITGVRAGSASRHAYHQMEIHYGEFRTDVELPAPVDSEAVEANYGDGFLTVVLPKKSQESVRVIEK